MFVTDPWYVAVAAATLYFTIVTLVNLRHFSRTRRIPAETDGPTVSILLPVRNEEQNLGPCLEALARQGYRRYEIIVIDDDSGDRTAEIAAGYAEIHPEVRLIRAGPLPSGWMGKQHACDRGMRIARGEFLFLTDADVRHRPDSVGRAVAASLKANADFVSGYIRQDLGSLGEMIVVPMMYVMTALLLPVRLLTSRIFPGWGFAVGQYMLVRTAAFADVGGFAAIKDSLVDDMAMARAMKAGGYRTGFIDVRDSASCRMYNGYRDACRGFAKSIFGAVGGQAWVVVLLGAVLGGLVVLPALAVLAGPATGTAVHAPLTPAVVLFFVTWAMALSDRKLPLLCALIYPISFANLLAIGVVSMIRTGLGVGIEWKGRMVRCGRPDLPDPYVLNVVGLYRLVSLVVYSLVFALVVVHNRLVFGLSVEGRAHLKQVHGGFFLISNHSLYLDPAIVAHAVFPKRTYFSALPETFERPFLGGFIRLLGAFPLPRSSCIRRILPAIEWALSRGACVHFFPEGELRHYNRSLRSSTRGFSTWPADSPCRSCRSRSSPIAAKLWAGRSAIRSSA